MRLVLITLALAAAFGCGGGRQQIEIGPPPPKQTTGMLSGPWCNGAECTCREGNAEPGEVPAGKKRFEIKLGSAYDLWLTLPGTVLYKNPERAEACFYIDLAPGQHPLQLRASNKNGVSLALEIHEWGSKTKSWYDTFRFDCGHPGVCSFEVLDTKKGEYADVKRGLHDPCGSTRIKGVFWDHGKSPDQLYPSELAVNVTLDVYKFTPVHAHGESCGEGTGRVRPDEPEPATQAP